MNKTLLEEIIKKNPTPFLVIDHETIRKNYQEFKEHLPRVQIYYAVKSNAEPEIIETLYKLGSSFDVASLQEFNLVFDKVKDLPPKKLQDFIWNNIIYANPVKKIDSLHVLNLYKPLLTYDCIEELDKIKTHCPDAGVLLRIKVSNKGSVVELSNKFGIEPKSAPDLIIKTIKAGINVEGISFHAGSQCNNPKNFIEALESIANIFESVSKKGYQIGETVTKGYPVKLIDIGGGFPVNYDGKQDSFKGLSKILNKTFERLFPRENHDILAEPGRYLIASSGTAVSSVILAKNSKSPPCYHLDDGVYHTFSAMIYDHIEIDLKTFVKGKKQECIVFGPTCDGLDTLSENHHIPSSRKVYLPRLEYNDIVYARNMGAYSTASSTYFNGIPPAKIIHINK